jgi:hypothetical protein
MKTIAKACHWIHASGAMKRLRLGVDALNRLARNFLGTPNGIGPMVASSLHCRDLIYGASLKPGTVGNIFGPIGGGKTWLVSQLCLHAAREEKKIFFWDLSGGVHPWHGRESEAGHILFCNTMDRNLGLEMLEHLLVSGSIDMLVFDGLCHSFSEASGSCSNGAWHHSTPSQVSLAEDFRNSVAYLTERYLEPSPAMTIWVEAWEELSLGHSPEEGPGRFRAQKEDWSLGVFPLHPLYRDNQMTGARTRLALSQMSEPRQDEIWDFQYSSNEMTRDNSSV